METLGILPMIETSSSPNGNSDENSVQFSAVSCDDIPCNCNCDCYDCVDSD